MKKEKGFTLIELMLSMALVAVLVFMITPLLTSIKRTNRMNEEWNQLDINMGRTIDVFKRAVRSSQPIESGWAPNGTITLGKAIYLAVDKNAEVKATGTTSSAILVNVPRETATNSGIYENEKVIFYFDSTSERLMLNSTTGTTMPTTNPVVLAENVVDANFSYGTNHIATIYLKVRLNPNDNTRFKEIRDAAVTRINIQF